MTDVLEPTDTRVPPQDLAAEQATLGAMLISTHAIADVTEVLTASDFYDPRHATIHNTILDLYTRGEPVDAISIGAALTNQGDLARVGGAPYIHTLLAAVPTAANGTWYARRVRELAEDRKLIEAGTRIVQLAGTPTRDPANPKSAQATKYLYDAISSRASETLVPVGNSIDDTMKAIEAGPQYGLSTGFTDLDALTGGLGQGQLWLWGARPSIGKSTAVMDVARAVAIRQRKPVLYFSLEMSRHQLNMRILSAESRVPHARLRAGGNHLDDTDWARLATASGEIATAPLFVDDRAGLSVVDILTASRRQAARTPLGLIVIDHLHLLAATGGGKNDTRNLELSRMTAALKVAAKDLGTTVAAAAQLNRGPEQRTDKRPVMADMRDSGSLEQDADVVILLHRDDYYDRESPRAGEADFIVAKNRDGATDTVTVAAQLHLSRFVDMAI